MYHLRYGSMVRSAQDMRRDSPMDSNFSERPFRGVILFGVLALSLSALLVIVGCTGSGPSSSSQQSSTVSAKHAESGPLKVAVQHNALSIPTVFAHDRGYFADEGLEIELFTYANGAEENKAIEKGDVDIASNGLASVYMLATGDFSWIGESDVGSSTVAIYMREGSAPTQVSGQLEDNPEIMGSVDTLRGLTVVGPAGTMEEWVAVSYFSQFGLSAGKDFQFIEMDRDQAVESVMNGDADVFVATDVDYCRIMEENGFVAVVKGADAARVPFNNGYLASNEVLESRYDDLISFLSAVYRASETLNADPDLWADFSLAFYKAHGKPATLEDVKRELEVRSFLVPADFEAPDYRLGAGVLDVGLFDAEIGALEDSQVVAIEKAINTAVIDNALGIMVKAATLNED